MLHRLTAIGLLCVGGLAAAQDLPLINGDFSQPMVGDKPPGWRLEQHAGPPAYEYKVVPDDVPPDNPVFRLRRLKEQVYGAIIQELPLSVPAGKEVELSARMKTAAVGPEGWLLILDFIGKAHRLLPPTSVAQFRSAPLSGDQKWRDVTLRAVTPEGATALRVSALLRDAGTGWIDDVRVRVLP